MSITLTNALTITQGASTVESNPQAAAMSVAADFQLANPALIITLKAGNVSGLSLTPGSIRTGEIIISIDLGSGRWSATNGSSGTLGAGALNTLLTNLKGFRNAAETFAVSNNIVAGSQVPWP